MLHNIVSHNLVCVGFYSYITPKTHTPEEILQLAETIAIKRQKRIVVCIDEFRLLITRLSKGETATALQLESAISDLLDANELLFIQQTESLTTYQMNFLRALMSGVSKDFGEQRIRDEYQLGSSSNIPRLKSALISRDLVDYDGNRYLITDPIFVLWFRRKGY